MATSELPQTFDFELVSPERLVVSEPSTLAVIPCADGEIGVLPGHSPLLAAVRPGVIKITFNNETKKVFVAGGFVDVSPQICSVLAEVAIPVNELDEGALKKELEELREDERRFADEADKAKTIAGKIALTEAKIAAIHTE